MKDCRIKGQERENSHMSAERALVTITAGVCMYVFRCGRSREHRSIRYTQRRQRRPKRTLHEVDGYDGDLAPEHPHDDAGVPRDGYHLVQERAAHDCGFGER